ncbi:hypothetical protein JOC77_000529 [Peribacillus deserti]|uniref:Sporulation protein n=1 Tax=Peribacillus deserti TaxID=673318 RepID=A0ABS2QE88_9BACI|nr:YhcN/YlaJ family sporulation lipoprotein [Peribacillus deserti]MBM7691124.1 hypothetical protein [Peribacillus deserti]
MKKVWVIFSFLVVLAGLSACGNNGNDNGVNNRGNNEATRIRNDVGNGNKNLRNENRIEKQVEELRSVDQAHVIVTGNKAYVAVRNQDDNNGNNNGNDGMMGNRNGENGNNIGNRNGGTTGNTDVGIGNDIATDDDNGMGQYGGFGDGNRLGDDVGINNDDRNMTDNNNNNGNNGDKNYSKVSTKREQQIADKVRETDKSIHKVYVSFDNEVYGRFGDFDNDMRNGNNDGLFDNFNNYVRGIFNGR